MLISAVVNSWLTQSKYKGINGKTLSLSFGEHGEFEEFVKQHSSDMTPHSILDEMEAT